jgi:cytidylate kinase
MVVIAVSGLHGAGKTTVAAELAKRFGLRHICAGEIFRRMASERGMSLEEFNRYAETHPEIDRELDRRTIEEAKKGNAVVDARLAGWIVEADFKILLTAPLQTRAERISRREGKNIEEVLKETQIREESEARRFLQLYGIDVNDFSVFDLILNTGRLSEKQTKEIIVSAVEKILR